MRKGKNREGSTEKRQIRKKRGHEYSSENEYFKSCNLSLEFTSDETEGNSKKFMNFR